MEPISWAIVASVPLAGPGFARGPPKTGDHVVRNCSHVIPGKSLVAVEVVYPPGSVSTLHHHAKSAFISAYVVSGSIRSQLEGKPPRVYKAGESIFDEPGAHHLAGENVSETEPVKLLAVFVVDTDYKELATLNK
ncbi:cupin domain-containing protein [Roseomonas sp. WA12]